MELKVLTIRIFLFLKVSEVVFLRSELLGTTTIILSLISIDKSLIKDAAELDEGGKESAINKKIIYFLLDDTNLRKYSGEKISSFTFGIFKERLTEEAIEKGDVGSKVKSGLQTSLT